MKKVRLNELENNKNNKLKQYKLDKDSINEFRSKIKQVSDEESKKLFFDLYELVISKEFYDDYLKVIELIYNGAIVNYYSKNYDLFDICIRNNYIKTLIVLLRSGLDIGAFNFNQMSPIMLCSKVGNKEILELLILMGADVNLKNEYGDTALSLALENDHMECANILINSQIHLNCRKISNDSLINTGESNESLSFLHDKSIYPVKEVSVDNLIKEAEDLLNSVDNTSRKLTNEIKFDLLSIDQIFGNNQLDILSKYGTRCAITDFAILLGGFVSCLYTNEGKNRKNRTDWWWTKSYFKYNTVHIVNVAGIDDGYNVFKILGGVRPVLSYSSIQSISSNEVRDINDIKEIDYGEYPQTIVDENYSRELETAYNNRSLKTTEKKYTTNSVFLSRY